MLSKARYNRCSQMGKQRTDKLDLVTTAVITCSIKGLVVIRKITTARIATSPNNRLHRTRTTSTVWKVSSVLEGRVSWVVDQTGSSISLPPSKPLQATIYLVRLHPPCNIHNVVTRWWIVRMGKSKACSHQEEILWVALTIMAPLS